MVKKSKATGIDITKAKLQSWANYMRQTLVFMRNRAIQKNFSFYFSTAFC